MSISEAVALLPVLAGGIVAMAAAIVAVARAIDTVCKIYVKWTKPRQPRR